MKMPSTSTCLCFAVDMTSFLSITCCGSLSTLHRFADSKLAKSTKWPPVIFETKLSLFNKVLEKKKLVQNGGTCRPIANAFSNAGGEGDAKKTLAWGLLQAGNKIGARQEAQLKMVMVDMGVKVLTKGVKGQPTCRWNCRAPIRYRHSCRRNDCWNWGTWNCRWRWNISCKSSSTREGGSVHLQ